MNLTAPFVLSGNLNFEKRTCNFECQQGLIWYVNGGTGGNMRR